MPTGLRVHPIRGSLHIFLFRAWIAASSLSAAQGWCPKNCSSCCRWWCIRSWGSWWTRSSCAGCRWASCLCLSTVSWRESASSWASTSGTGRALRQRSLGPPAAAPRCAWSVDISSGTGLRHIESRWSVEHMQSSAKTDQHFPWPSCRTSL